MVNSLDADKSSPSTINTIVYQRKISCTQQNEHVWEQNSNILMHYARRLPK